MVGIYYGFCWSSGDWLEVGVWVGDHLGQDNVVLGIVKV